ncbi:DUF3011 domain-containing protein [Tahibacter amnicola]|uniref:DUF3011 domain-containing protein n=1 Tax=Tahibacter amnicola TaxID=2976241 RepID=A0ABY6BCX1_9GAMM|nr:DUF3011 domain-containing protein [Tahibacter amnicola]UXI67680.1 DUF3011 domain-containing protein [Tahibacter amnicola]
MIARTLALAALVVGSAFSPGQVKAQGYAPDSIECYSRDYRYNRCEVDWRDARLVRQLSGSRCVRGETWGINERGLWVDQGCAGLFEEAGRRRRRDYDDDRGDHHGGGWRPGHGWDQDIRLRCDSNDFRYQLCQVDVGRGGRVYIEQQISNTRCVEGRNWGYHRAGVWVDGGCAAIFKIERRWRD